MEQKEKRTALSLINRSELLISGILDIINSDENSIYLDTLDDGLIIEGSELHIISMNVQNREISIEGNVDSISYHSKSTSTKTGFWARILKW